MASSNNNYFDKPLFRASYFNEVDQKETIELVQRKLAPEVLEELKRQNISSEPAVNSALKKLEENKVVIVFTGQQLGFLGGPLLTLYKIITTIQVARKLEEKFGTSTVPIFWMQAEDHDFEEIKSSNFVDSSGNIIKLDLESDLNFVQQSVGRNTNYPGCNYNN